MRRVFVIDVLECPRCRGWMRIVAAIHPPEAAAARGTGGLGACYFATRARAFWNNASSDEAST
jgi:hypothetical protein